MIKVGDRFKNTKGSEYVVVDYKNYENITVEFCDDNKYRTIKSADCVKAGNIKNPFQPLLFGIGYFGVGPHKSKAGPAKQGYPNLPAYSSWVNMLSRCYDKNYISHHIYENTKVHVDWHCFQTFADWYSKQLLNARWPDRTCTDKDILGDGTVYSSYNCCLVPACINTAVTTSHGGIYLQGVIKSTNGLYRVISGYSCSDDRFSDEKTAHMAFVEAKSEKIKQLANEYKEFLRPDVYETLMTKDFRFKFSPFFRKRKILTEPE